MFCTQCGHENTPGSRFCSACGAPLTSPGAGSAGQERPDDDPSASTSTISLGQVQAERGDDESSAILGDLPADDQGAVHGLPAGCALLIVVRGPSSGSRYLLDTDVVTAGRHPDSDIFLDDVTVSRRHAEFRRLAEGFAVRDVGSLNGTYVNRDRIDDVLLSDGDEVQIGKFRMVHFASRRTGAETTS